MLNIAIHGGRCCGIRHLWSFRGTETVEEIKEKLRHTRQLKTQGMLVEVVLTNSQLKRSPSLGENLQKAGFKLVNRFKNPNSGNICNVFHYNQSPRSLTHRLPFKLLKEEKTEN